MQTFLHFIQCYSNPVHSSNIVHPSNHCYISSCQSEDIFNWPSLTSIWHKAEHKLNLIYFLLLQPNCSLSKVVNPLSYSVSSLLLPQQYQLLSVSWLTQAQHLNPSSCISLPLIPSYLQSNSYQSNNTLRINLGWQCQSNTYREALYWVYFIDESKVQRK